MSLDLFVQQNILGFPVESADQKAKGAIAIWELVDEDAALSHMKSRVQAILKARRDRIQREVAAADARLLRNPNATVGNIYR